MKKLKLNRDRAEMLMELLDEYINKKPISGSPLVKEIEIRYGDTLSDDSDSDGSFEVTPICNTIKI